MVKYFKTPEERKEFFHKILNCGDSIIGGNGTCYMNNTCNDTHFGHQHYMYPWSWIKPLMTIERFSLIGIWGYREKDTNHKDIEIIPDYFTDISKLIQDKHGNWNGVNGSLTRLLSEEMLDELLAICIYRSGGELKNYIVLKK